jgi:hypothetical protein
MHFDWTIRRERVQGTAESLIPCGFLGPTSLFYADNVHVRFRETREAVEPLSRFRITRYSAFAKPLFQSLIPANVTPPKGPLPRRPYAVLL